MSGGSGAHAAGVRLRPELEARQAAGPLTWAVASAAPGQMEAIVVGTCILFFFLVLMAALLCIYKEDM